MELSLNSEQAKALSNFLFDIAKGLVLGGVGFSFVVSLQTKLITLCLSLAIAFWCVKAGLFLLKEDK